MRESQGPHKVKNRRYIVPRMNAIKQCTICNQKLQITSENFSYNKYTNKLGETKMYWSSYCKICNVTKNKEWRQNNKTKCAAIEKRYRLKHSEDVKCRKSKYKKNNKEKISEYNKRYRVEHREEFNKREKTRMKNDIAFRLRKTICRSVQKAISKNGISITKYLPYTLNMLKMHLENQFESWMTWDNHGCYNPQTWNDSDSGTWTWQIDHIIPQSILIYVSMSDLNFQKCWALDNLRPLSAKQNVIDGASKVRHS